MDALRIERAAVVRQSTKRGGRRCASRCSHPRGWGRSRWSPAAAAADRTLAALQAAATRRRRRSSAATWRGRGEAVLEGVGLCRRRAALRDRVAANDSASPSPWRAGGTRANRGAGPPGGRIRGAWTGRGAGAAHPGGSPDFRTPPRQLAAALACARQELIEEAATPRHSEGAQGSQGLLLDFLARTRRQLTAEIAPRRAAEGPLPTL